MIRHFLATFIIYPFFILSAQPISWVDISDQYTLPEGAQLFKGRRENPPLNIWYLDVDLNQADIAIRPYITQNKTGITSFISTTNAYAGINGGYFDLNSSTSYSAVVYPDELKAQNISILNRDGTVYPATRSFFGLDHHLKMSVNWIWHFDATVEGLYTFTSPTPNAIGSPASNPVKEDGSPYDSLLVGIGGGPTLVKNGQVNVTYYEEVFFGSGVGLNNPDPRTGIGFTNYQHVILLVADGRQTDSDGVSLPELAQIFIDLGCVEAMNLDGGGSSQLAVGGNLINRPEGSTYQRPIPTIMAVVHRDSLNLPEQPILEKTYDTEDSSCTFIGGAWNQSANSGYWAGTPARYTSVGNGDKYARFYLDLNVSGLYEVDAWWVHSSNRAKDTPVIIRHRQGIDTVRVDQTTDGAQWVYIGEYLFRGDATESVTISNNASSGQYVVADGIRLVAVDTAAATGVPEITKIIIPGKMVILQNYPNPFNGETSFRLLLATPAQVNFEIYDLLGRKIRTLLSGAALNAGEHLIRWDGSNEYGADLATGMYLARYTDGRQQVLLKTLIIR